MFGGWQEGWSVLVRVCTVDGRMNRKLVEEQRFTSPLEALWWIGMRELAPGQLYAMELFDHRPGDELHCG